MNGFAVDPSNSKVMYAGLRDGLFKSTDAGQTWKSVGKEFKNMVSVAINPKKPADVYASTFDGVVIKSTDAGMVWKRLR